MSMMFSGLALLCGGNAAFVAMLSDPATADPATGRDSALICGAILGLGCLCLFAARLA